MHEQNGGFAYYWKSFHPLLKERWSKTQFITDRLHVFIGHFGTETFQFTIKLDNKIKYWKIAEEP